jgi:hypothetical protein
MFGWTPRPPGVGAESAIACVASAPGSVDSDSDGVCDGADACPDDDGNTCDSADTRTIFACVNRTNGKIYGLTSPSEPAGRKDDDLIRWKSSLVGE